MFYNENMQKAYVQIFGYCNKVMKSQIEKNANYESEIQNDPLRLLKKIKMEDV